VAPPVFKTGLAAIAVAGGFDSLPPPPSCFALRASQDWLATLERSRMPSEAVAKEGLTSDAHVYLIESLTAPHERYVGYSGNLRQRILEHNEGKSTHTAKFNPWRLVLR
jgi:hypothetical protein